MDNKEKLKMLQNLDEKRLTKEILIPLFEKISFKNVVYTHGVLEYGKDIIYCEETKFHKQKYVGVQVKSGDINTKNVDKIFCQVTRGLGKPYEDISDNNKEKPIDEFIILSSGEIKENARENVSKSLRAVHIDKPISFITGEELVRLINEYMPSAFWEEYDYFSNYFNAMKKEFETIKDISAIGQKEPIPLENIYVSLRVCENVRMSVIPKKKEQKIFDEELINREAIRQIKREKVLDSDRAVKEYDKLLIVGVPGSGKTTLLRHLALKFCMENLEKQKRINIPVLITLHEFSEKGISLREYINDVFDKYQFSKAKKFIMKELKNGNCMLLLDGFDEVVTKEKQEKVADHIHKFIEKYHKSQIVITSRVSGYHDELEGFTKLELMEFDETQIEKFIGNWFGKTNPKKAKSMLKAVMKNKRIKALSKNPLMIAIIAIIYEEDRELPQKRAELYKRCVDVLLSRWDVNKKLKNLYTSEKKEFILRKLAFYGHSINKRIMIKEEVIMEMLKYFSQVSLKKEVAKPFLKEICEKNSILRQISIDSYDFLHLSFQEYFTALELKEKEDGISTIIKHLHDPWWEEPIILYAGISKDATTLIRKIKEEKEDIFYSNLMLIGKCVADADFTKPYLREEIIKDLWSLYQTAEFSHLKEKSIKVLALIKPDNIINSLTKNLKDKESDVRENAAYDLERIGSEKAIETLIKVLNTDKNMIVQSLAATALGKIGSEKAIKPLIKAVTTDKESIVRRNAAYALERIGSEKAIGPLIKVLTTAKESDFRESAATALGRIGSEKAIVPLIKALSNDKERNVRESAAIALGVIGNEKAIGPLIKALTTDEVRNVRGSAAIALGVIGNEKVIGPLIKVLTTGEDGEIRRSAAYALGKTGNEKAIGPLIKALTTDEVRNVRGSAAYALERIGSEQVIGPLIKALTNDKESYVQMTVAILLGEIGSEKVIGPLIKVLTTNEEGEVRGSAATALGEIGSEEAIEPLIKALTTDEVSEVRGSAAYALGRIGSEEAIEPLIKALTTDEVSEVRGSAAKALGRIGSEKAIEPLKSAFKDEEEYFFEKVKDIAFTALEKISCRIKKRITVSQLKIPINKNIPKHT